jgi:hypothetical protein
LAAHTLGTDDDVFPVGLDGFEEGVWLSGQVAMKDDLAMPLSHAVESVGKGLRMFAIELDSASVVAINDS